MDIFIQKYITEGCDEVKCHPTSAHAELIRMAAESLSVPLDKFHEG